MKNIKGITLVALTITIILMLILAGVILTMSIGENGIIQYSKYAKKEMKNTQTQENIILEEYANIIDKYTENPKMLYADSFSFTPQNSTCKVQNVKEALDDLYNRLYNK